MEHLDAPYAQKSSLQKKTLIPTTVTTTLPRSRIFMNEKSEIGSYAVVYTAMPQNTEIWPHTFTRL